ncbi:MAG TPA: phosphotransferase [Acidimicrobiia bacterium]|nr:phosphotransferase [Acidimicrobiia bacterium]
MLALTEELRRRIGDPSLEVLAVEPFGGGHSGLTYAVDLRVGGIEQRCVLRTSPPGVAPVGPNDLGRQGRVILAARRAGLPVPAVLAMSAEPVLGGRAYLLVELVDGTGWEEAVAGHGPRAVAAEAVRLLSGLAAVAGDATGIGDEAPTTPAGEVDRWDRLVVRSPDELGPPAAKLRRRLVESMPAAAGPPVLVHGDLHYGNLLFRNGRIAAVLDWEIAGLGDPLLDLGSLAVASRQPASPPSRTRPATSTSPSPTWSPSAAPMPGGRHGSWPCRASSTPPSSATTSRCTGGASGSTPSTSASPGR